MTKIRINRCLLLVISLVAVAGLGSCKKNEPENKPQPSTPQKQANIPAVPVQKQNSSAKKLQGGTAASVQKQTSSVRHAPAALSMDFANRKDPFKAFAQPAPKSGEKSLAPLATMKRGEDLLPIQSFETEKFKVTGIIAGMKENRALIIDPAGKGYVVKEGMLIGNNAGVISKISATSVEVLEKFRDDNGHVRKRSIKLTLIRKK